MTITSLYLGCFINSCFLEELQTDALQLKAMEAQNLLLLEHFQQPVHRCDAYEMEESGAAGDSSANVQIPDKTKLIVNYIPQLASEEELHAMFSQVGVVENVRIMRDNRTGYSYGFGFVKYTSPQFAEAAITKFNGLQFKNKRLKVSYSRPPSQEMKDSNLYITNLPKETTEYELHELFKPYGTIVQKTLLKDKYSGMPRGVAFVRFSCHSEAQAAIDSLNGKHLEHAMHPLSVRVAEDHGRQKAQFIEQFANTHVHMCCNRGFVPCRTTVQPLCVGNFCTGRSIAFHGHGAGRLCNRRHLGLGDGDAVYPNMFW